MFVFSVRETIKKKFSDVLLTVRTEKYSQMIKTVNWVWKSEPSVPFWQQLFQIWYWERKSFKLSFIITSKRAKAPASSGMLRSVG
jgi:hypothetical protein